MLVEWLIFGVLCVNTILVLGLITRTNETNSNVRAIRDIIQKTTGTTGSAKFFMHDIDEYTD